MWALVLLLVRSYVMCGIWYGTWGTGFYACGIGNILFAIFKMLVTETYGGRQYHSAIG